MAFCGLIPVSAANISQVLRLNGGKLIQALKVHGTAALPLLEENLQVGLSHVMSFCEFPERWRDLIRVV